MLVENDLRLRHLEIKRAGGEPDTAKLLGKLMHGKDGRDLTLGHPDAAAAAYHRHHLFVREARLGTDDGFRKPAGYAASLAVKSEKRRERKTVLPRHKRTYAVGQGLRQHGNNAVQEIHARRPAASLAVERRPWSDVVRYVGDVYAQYAIAFAVLLYGQGVIKILRGNRIAGEDELLAEIQPILPPLDARLLDLPRLVQHHPGKLVGKIVLLHHSLDVILGREPFCQREFFPLLPLHFCLILFHAANYTIFAARNGT